MKYNVFEKQNEMDVRNAQIVYLHDLAKKIYKMTVGYVNK